ncbi:MAG TPA: DegT/DnrJ/EryC1/StrS family aminotransferase [Caulobacteraceae bacterium]
MAPSSNLAIAHPMAAPQSEPVGVARPLLPALEALEPYLRRIDANRWYANLGPLVLELEGRLAERFVRPTRIVTAANGTQAITLALRAAGATDGYCALPAWTFVATAHAAIQAGLTPWLLDVDPETWMLDPASVKNALRQAPGKVAAVVPVLAFGRPVDLQAWAAFRLETGIPVIADAAAGFDGLDRAPVPVTVSLHATKALGVGEGGYIATEDPAFADRVREQTNFGFRAPRLSDSSGTNAKLSEYAAAVGLAALDAWPSTRIRLLRAGQQLRMAMALDSRAAFQPGWGVSWVSTTCVVGVPDGWAPALAETATAAGVETRQWWGAGCHRHPAFADLPRTSLEVTDHLAVSTLGLPFAIDLGGEAIERIARTLRTG